ncbi:hypothetical protein RJ639_030957 [Escallonia herrerae]|uniref:Uncharacterized protein n=1 Tax=Escallonia herrerae TaxID=1293975 RepID=A0AA88WYC7_9ASTE|nr:hypothetical protein RJ639_030957 [Escallonia herrerae]
MASALPPSFTCIMPSQRSRTGSSFKVKAQSFRDEGKSCNMVDENLILLRQRVEQVRIKERLERCCTSQHGWNYTTAYNYKHKREAVLSQYFELIGLVGGTAGLAIVNGTMLLCLVSLFVHLNH